jgi:PAS domain-containing protein
MPAESVPAIETQRLAELRGRAASRLAGLASTKGSTARSADALSVLHALASSPSTAADALTLLHELQVHQVELDLQEQELQESRAELEHALRRQVQLYHHQPVGSFTVDPGFVLHELNQTGADMLGLACDDALGLPLDAFFSVESARRFKLATSGLDASTRRASLQVRLQPKSGPERQVVASISADPAARRFLVSLTEAVGETAQRSEAS